MLLPGLIPRLLQGLGMRPAAFYVLHTASDCKNSMHTASDLETGKAWELDKLVNVEFKTCCVHKSFQLCVYRHPFLSVVGGPAWWEERSVSLDIHIFIDLWQLRTGKV